MKLAARVALWGVVFLALAAGVIAIVLILPGQPSASRAVRFDGYIPLPAVKNGGPVTVLDYMNVTGDDLYVAGATSGAVYKIALRAHPLPASTDISVLAGPPSPHGVVIDPIGGLAFVTRSKVNSVDVFDPRTMRPIRRIAVAEDPDAITFDASDKLVYAASGGAKTATLIDPPSKNVIAAIPLGGEPEFAAFDPKTGRVYQNLSDVNELVAVDASKRSVVQRWPLSGCEMPTGMALDAGDRRLFIACAKSSKLLVFDLEGARVARVVPIAFGADSVAYDAQLRKIYTTGLLGKLTVIQQITADAYRVADTVSLHFNAHTLAIDPATHRVFVGYSSLAIPPRVAVFTPR